MSYITTLDEKKANEVLKGSLDEYNEVKKLINKKIPVIQKYESEVRAVHVLKNSQ